MSNNKKNLIQNSEGTNSYDYELSLAIKKT